jgi:hypothetical protein
MSPLYVGVRMISLESGDDTDLDMQLYDSTGTILLDRFVGHDWCEIPDNCGAYTHSSSEWAYVHTPVTPGANYLVRVYVGTKFQSTRTDGRTGAEYRLQIFYSGQNSAPDSNTLSGLGSDRFTQYEVSLIPQSFNGGTQARQSFALTGSVSLSGLDFAINDVSRIYPFYFDPNQSLAFWIDFNMNISDTGLSDVDLYVWYQTNPLLYGQIASSFAAATYSENVVVDPKCTYVGYICNQTTQTWKAGWVYIIFEVWDDSDFTLDPLSHRFYFSPGDTSTFDFYVCANDGNGAAGLSSDPNQPFPISVSSNGGSIRIAPPCPHPGFFFFLIFFFFFIFFLDLIASNASVISGTAGSFTRYYLLQNVPEGTLNFTVQPGAAGDLQLTLTPKSGGSSTALSSGLSRTFKVKKDGDYLLQITMTDRRWMFGGSLSLESTVPSSGKKSSSSVNIAGAVAGAVIGFFCLILIIVLIIFGVLFLRRRSGNEESQVELYQRSTGSIAAKGTDENALDFREINILKEIGRGAFGVVYLGFFLFFSFFLFSFFSFFFFFLFFFFFFSFFFLFFFLFLFKIKTNFSKI